MRRITRALAVAVSLILLGTLAAGNMTAQVLASEQAPADTAEKPESEMTEEEKKAKEEKEAYEKEIQACYDLPVDSNDWPNWPQGPGTYGYAGIVMDADSGMILYAKDIDSKRYPASITKVLTALLAFRYGDMSSQVTISKDALACLGSGYASIGLKEGNVITMEQAMYAMLLASANEAAYAVGESVAASQGQEYDWFIDQMNATTTELGGVNSNFINTNGVYDEKHYTCARDMALIGSALFDYPQIREICQTQQYIIPASGTVEEHVFQQKHHMLIVGNKDYDERVVAGKTGYTTEAQNTLITLADNGERRLVCVVLQTYGGYPYSDTKALLDYGFDKFQNLSVEEADTRGDFAWVEEGASVTLPEGVGFDQLARQVDLYRDGTDKAIVTYYYEDMTVGTCEVIVSENYKNQHDITTETETIVTEPEKEPEPEKEQTTEAEGFFDRYKSLAVVGAAVLLLFCGVIAMIVTRISRKRKRRRRRR